MDGHGAGIVGIEGTHGAGKSTVAHALVARLREAGQGPTLVADAGRTSPFVQARLHGQESSVPVLLQELSLLGARMKAEVEAAHDGGIVVCDKTVFGGLAYLRLFAADQGPDPLLDAAQRLCVEYARRMYDLIVLLDRRFDWSSDPVPDPGRYVDPELQIRYQQLVQEELTASGVPLLVRTDKEDAWTTAGVIVGDLRERGLV